MKKRFILAACISAMLVCGSAVYAEKAILPPNTVTFNGTCVDSHHRQYPLISYKDIVYFPMTYFDSAYLGLTANWDNATRTLEITKTGVSCAYRTYASETATPEVVDAAICSFNVVVNGKNIDNSLEEYPLLNYNDITYFPLTWRFAVDEFGWQYSYTDEEGLKITSDNSSIHDLTLPGLGGKLAAATDGEYWYYTGENNTILRTLVSDESVTEIIHTMPEDPNGGVWFEAIGKDVYLYYHIGGASMGRTYRYAINKDGTCVLSGAGSHHSSSIGANRYFYDGEYVKVDTYNSGQPGNSAVYYTVNEVQTQITQENMIFGETRKNGVAAFKNAYAVGGNIYVAGYSTADNSDSNVYSVNSATGEITCVLEGVTNYYAYSGWDNSLGAMTDMLMYCKNGTLYRMSAGKETEIISGVCDIYDAVTYEGYIFVAHTDGTKYQVSVFDGYGIGSVHSIIFETTEPGYFTRENGVIAFNCYTDGQPRFVLFNKLYGYLKTVDLPERVFFADGTLIYRPFGESRLVVSYLK